MEYRDEKNTGIGVKVTDKTVSLELNTDLSLPDYLGEVSRLLWVRPHVSAPTRFLGGGNAEFSGRICYHALYAGADGRLYCADAEDTYSFNVPTSAPRADLLSVTLFPDVMVGRVAAPRKLSFRCKMHAHVCGYGEKSVETVLPPEAGEDVCRLWDMTECGKILLGEGEIAEAYGEVDAEGMRVLTSRAEVFLPEVSAHSGAVQGRGEVIVTLLCQKEGSEEGKVSLPRAITHRLPLAFEVPLDGVGVDHEVRALATVEDIRVVENGGKLSVAVRVLPWVEAICREPVAYTKDLFRPRHDTECHHSEERCFLPGVFGNKNFSISGNFPFGAVGMPEGASVIDAVAEAEVKEEDCDGKNVSLTGDIHCHVLFSDAGEFGTGEVSVPFRVVMGGCFEELSVKATVPSVCVRAERGSLRVDAELQVSVAGLVFQTIAPVSDASFKPRESGLEADLLLCYPAPHESLWEVARRYAVAPAEIAAQNGIDTEDMDDRKALSGVPFLMIPTAK